MQKTLKSKSHNRCYLFWLLSRYNHIVIVFCPVMYSAIGTMPIWNTHAATNKTTKSVGVNSVLLNADTTTFQVIKQVSKMLVKE